MPKEYDLSDVLANTASTPAKKKRKGNLKWFITAGLAVVIIIAFLIGVNVFYAKNNFDNKIPLTENISRWNSLAWDNENHFTGDISNSTGDWAFDKKNGVFTNDANGCQALFTQIGGDYGSYSNDLKDSQNYQKKFIKGQEKTSVTSKVYVSLAGHPNGGIQMLKTYYRGSNDTYNVTYYRHSPANETVVFGVVSCKTEEALNKLMPIKGDGSEVKTLGFWLKVR